jgi:hypothetical protein
MLMIADLADACDVVDVAGGGRSGDRLPCGATNVLLVCFEK